MIKNMSPLPHRKAGPNSHFDRVELTDEINKFYKDLSSSSESSISDHLSKLKNLFKECNLEKRYSRPNSR